MSSISFDDIREYLRQPLIARMGTIDDDGTPHIVPLWYVVEENRDEIVIMTDSKTRKTRNAAARSQGAIQIGGDPTGTPNQYTPGYLLQGEFVVAPDADRAALKRITRHYVPGEQAEALIAQWSADDIVEIRLRVTKIVKVM
jgi:nitroimidazol reductase NimA-like FMN-containing flavoprotein (pyridoxamine 5'-phosphate oxidase superfamily)